MHDEGHGLDHHAWDEVGKRNLTLAQASPDMAMVLEMIAEDADAGTIKLTSGIRFWIDAALIKAGRKAAPQPMNIAR
ncbi:hypothetical protein ABW54_03970 [Burkholderia cenocepacia]|nr:hypothetical protein ABW54_03970 [Burkholderia cenocepacia]